ncbi:hypothetical protein C0995_008483 [Termitomyces sp. Mi166|nr:hypothetical protein C0995_008483 [Termitomyces sp. Mi166\
MPWWVRGCAAKRTSDITSIQLYINEVVLGTAFGIAIGPYGADIFDPRSWDVSTIFLTREITRIVLATSLFAVGIELPKSYLAKHGKSLLVMVVPTMAIGWIIVSGVLFGLFPKLSYFSCLAIAACLTPTDPVVCAAVVGGKYAQKHVPLNLRQILSAESATNDGLAFPFLTISLYLILDRTKEEAVVHWVLVGCLYQVVMGTILGAISGLVFSHLMKFCHQRGFIDRESYVAQYLALSIFVAGVVSTIGSDDLLATFAAGSAISWNREFDDHTEGEAFATIVDLIFNCACFVYIGAWLPFKSFTSPELGITPWRLIVLFLSILALRRIPAIMRLGLGVKHYSMVTLLPAARNPPKNEQELLAACLEPMVAFTVLCSIIIHGLSIPFFSLGRATLSLTMALPSTTPDWIQHAPTNTPNSPAPCGKATSASELNSCVLQEQQAQDEAGITAVEAGDTRTVEDLVNI